MRYIVACAFIALGIVVRFSLLGLITFGVCWAFDLPFKWQYVVGVFLIHIVLKSIFSKE